MVGNDIVDLNVAKTESNWKRKGYLDKIYTLAEQDLITRANDPDRMVWILWTMKEAAYKANNRITSVREYAPSKIQCEIIQILDNIYYGKVQYSGRNYNSKTTVCEDYIHTVALFETDDFSTINEINVRNYPKDYEQYLKQNNYLAPLELLTKNKIGIPSILNVEEGSEKPISISHHGIFLSVVSIID